MQKLYNFEALYSSPEIQCKSYVIKIAHRKSNFMKKISLIFLISKHLFYVLIRPTVQRNLRSLNPFFLLSNQSQLSLDLVANDSSIWLKLF